MKSKNQKKKNIQSFTFIDNKAGAWIHLAKGNFHYFLFFINFKKTSTKVKDINGDEKSKQILHKWTRTQEKRVSYYLNFKRERATIRWHSRISSWQESLRYIQQCNNSSEDADVRRNKLLLLRVHIVLLTQRSNLFEQNIPVFRIQTRYDF